MVDSGKTVDSRGRARNNLPDMIEHCGVDWNIEVGNTVELEAMEASWIHGGGPKLRGSVCGVFLVGVSRLQEEVEDVVGFEAIDREAHSSRKSVSPESPRGDEGGGLRTDQTNVLSPDLTTKGVASVNKESIETLARDIIGIVGALNEQQGFILGA